MTKRYKGSKWDSIRERVLKRDLYVCRNCRRYGEETGAQMVHHVKPVKQSPELYLSTKNLLSLCNACHNKMHNRDTDELTALGLQWVQRIYGHDK